MGDGAIAPSERSRMGGARLKEGRLGKAEAFKDRPGVVERFSTVVLAGLKVFIWETQEILVIWADTYTLVWMNGWAQYGARPLC